MAFTKRTCYSLDKNALWLHLKDGHSLFMTIRIRYHLINIRDMWSSSFTFLPSLGCDNQIGRRPTLTQSRHSHKIGNCGNVVTQTSSITIIYLKYVGISFNLTIKWILPSVTSILEVQSSSISFLPTTTMK